MEKIVSVEGPFQIGGVALNVVVRSLLSCKGSDKGIWLFGIKFPIALICYEWHPRMSYQGFRVHWYSCEEVVEQEGSRFVWLSSMEMDCYSVIELSECGRLRWKIENQGFDVQKHHGYGLGHQFSRKSMPAMKNYYQLMQIAHMFNQLFALSSLLAEVRDNKESLTHIWLCIIGELRHEVLDLAVLATLLARRIRIRYD